MLQKLTLLLAVFAPSAFSQLTMDQKVADFMQLAGVYAKNYAPYEWKRDVMGFDLYEVKPWLDRVKASIDDMEFYDICVRYVASLQDSHDEYILSSDFSASLPIDVDIYDGKVLIDSINRSSLPRADYPFNIGDELISVDGKKALDLVEAYIPYSANGSGNPSARRRLAAHTITYRQQSFFPRAAEIGATSTIVVQDSSGKQSRYVLPWTIAGTPITHAGPVPSPRSAIKPALQKSRFVRHSQREETDTEAANPRNNAWGAWAGEPMPPEVEAVPPYLKTLREMQVSAAIEPAGAVAFGSQLPAFSPPPAYRARLGYQPNDPFISGTFSIGEFNVGFIRIPTMRPANQAAAIQQFATEMSYFNSNTEALVIDLMHNAGGDNCYIEGLAQYLFLKPFRGSAYEIRATQTWVQIFSSLLYQARADKAEQWVVDLYGSSLSQLVSALNQNRGMTGSIPICTPNFEDIQPATDKSGNLLAYKKPILILVDEFTLSAAESFAMFLQEQGRASVLGVRTAGGGGNPGTFQAGVYSEGTARVTRTFVTRAKPVTTPGFPPVDHLENVGVYPDFVVDYMTRDNLMNGGVEFIRSFGRALLTLIFAQ